jgi:hypothetical protein
MEFALFLLKVTRRNKNASKILAGSYGSVYYNTVLFTSVISAIRYQYRKYLGRTKL